MATHELYVGGPSTANYSRAMFPAPPFNAASAAFTGIRPAAHKGNTGYSLTRVLDTANKAIAEFLRENAVAQGDVIGSVIIPQDVIFKGLFYRLESPTGTGATVITPSLRGVGAATFPTIDANAAAGSKGFAKAGNAAWVTTSASIEAGAGEDFFIAAPTILDLTLTTLPADGLGALRLTLAPIVTELVNGQY